VVKSRRRTGPPEGGAAAVADVVPLRAGVSARREPAPLPVGARPPAAQTLRLAP
jgi:hypothetical protein